MKYILLLFLFIYNLQSCKKDDANNILTSNPNDTIPKLSGWELIWNDEFSDSIINLNKWEHEVNGDGGGNNELQYYTSSPENSFLANGKLVIVAKKQNYQGKNYTSARLRTKFKGDWLYGRVEVSAKIPAGVGTWPAIWMLPTDWEYGGWPQSGEIDIMEHVGYDPNVVHGSIHTDMYNHIKGTQKSAKLNTTAISEYHLYAVEWYKDSIDFYIDSKKYFTFYNEKKGWQFWPFDKRFHLILNLAVGGNWGGVKGIDDKAFPAGFVIEYVRVYKKSE